jgi:Na+-translocating ferredoxin:NAD+ oxidoreductase subunit B
MWWQAAAVLGGAGLLLGSGLAYVAVAVAVPPDPRATAVREKLPGANCGACGYPGCDGLAAAQVAGKAAPDACTAGGPAVAAAVAGLLGVAVAAGERKVAVVRCLGTPGVALEAYRYEGLYDCRAAALMPGGGPKACARGCLGLGTCTAACPFGALAMDPVTRLPVVDREACTGCSICVTACPKGVLAVAPESQPVLVACQNADKGPVVRKLCTVGCLGCGLCVRACPRQAITMKDNLAAIDPALCDGCGICVAKCPTKVIVAVLPLAAAAD